MGLTMDDIEKYGLKRHLIKFKDVDIARLKQIKNYEWNQNKMSEEAKAQLGL